jgi:hypothetical protein
MPYKKVLKVAGLACLLAASQNALASKVTEQDKKYSPRANNTQPNNVYWGDSHLHTGLSLDAGLFGNTVSIDDAYRLARGEQVIQRKAFR